MGEERREGEGRRLSPALGAAITGASPTGGVRVRNGREAEISGGYGRTDRVRVGVKKQSESAETV